MLDIGSGDASCASKMGYAQGFYLGLELDSNCIKELARKNLSVVRYDLESGSLPFVNEAFDVVLLSNILEHLNAHFEVTKEAYRVLRPGGKLYVSVPSEYSRYIWDDFTHKRGYTKHAIEAELRYSGFNNIKVQAEKSFFLTKNLNLLAKSVVSYLPKLALKYLCDIDRTTDTYLVWGYK